MDLGLDGKRAWVLGASSGLGLASARCLAGEGVSVAISARRAEDLEKLAVEMSDETGQRCIAVPLDVTDANGIAAAGQRVEDELGPLDICIANAGGPPPGVFEDLGDRELEIAYQLTTASAWRISKAVVPSMEARGSGVLIFLTSGSTKEVIPNLLLSNMMRAAVVGLAKTLSKELGPRGVRVLCVAPGRINTDRLRSLDEATARRSGRPVEQVEADNKARIPLERYGDPEEFGNVVAFLASPRASYVTGTTVVVDGGMLNGVLS